MHRALKECARLGIEQIEDKVEVNWEVVLNKARARDEWVFTISFHGLILTREGEMDTHLEDRAKSHIRRTLFDQGLRQMKLVLLAELEREQ